MKLKQLLLPFLMVLTIFFACKTNDEKDDESNELITSVFMHFTDSANQTTTFKWRQPGGPGARITRDTIVLDSGRTYRVRVEIWDESQTPAVDVTPDIRRTQNEHRFVYTSTTEAISIQVNDFDTNNPPTEVGLDITVSTFGSGPRTGLLRAVLRHYSRRSPKTAGPTAGSTDIDVEFPLVIM
jgi:hypothetical protein